MCSRGSRCWRARGRAAFCRRTWLAARRAASRYPGRAGDVGDRGEPAAAAGCDAKPVHRTAGRSRSGGCTCPAWRGRARHGPAAAVLLARRRDRGVRGAGRLRRVARAQSAGRPWHARRGRAWLGALAALVVVLVTRRVAGVRLSRHARARARDGAGPARRVRGLRLHGAAGARAVLRPGADVRAFGRARRAPAWASFALAVAALCWPRPPPASRRSRCASPRSARAPPRSRCTAVDGARAAHGHAPRTGPRRSRWCGSAGRCLAASLAAGLGVAAGCAVRRHGGAVRPAADRRLAADFPARRAAAHRAVPGVDARAPASGAAAHRRR